MAKSSNNPITREQFAAVMIERIKRSGGRFDARFIPEDFQLELLKDGKVVATQPLEKAYGQFLEFPPEQINGWWIQVLNYLLDPHDQPAALDERWPELRPAIRTRSCFDGKRIEAEIEQTEYDAIPFAPIGDHLAVCIARNLSNRTMQFVDESLLQDWKLPFRDAMRKARLNLDSIEANIIFAEDCVFSFDDEDAAFHPSRLLCWKTLRQFPINGDIIALAPTANSLFITGSDDKRGLEVLAIEGQRYFENPNPLCPIPVRRSGDKWVTWIPPAGHPQHETFLSFQRRFIFDEYQKQTDLLLPLVHTQDFELKVAPCSATQSRKSGKEFNITEWKRGERTLLPQVDSISLVEADGSQVALIAWDDAVEICGHLMARDPHRHPPRWRVESFPTDLELQQMGAVSPSQRTHDTGPQESDTGGTPAATAPTLSKGPPSPDAFAAVLIERLKQSGEKREFVYDKERFRLVASENGKVVESLFLGKWYDGLHSTPIVERNLWWAHALKQIQKLRSIPEPAPKRNSQHANIRPLICRRSYFEMVRFQSLADNLEVPRIPHWPLGDYLAVSAVHDLPDRMHYIHEGMLPELAMTAEQTLSKAIQAMEAEETGIISALDRVYLFDGHDSYNASCILLTKTIRSLPLKGDPVAVAVNRNRLFIASSDDDESLTLLSTLMEDAIDEPEQLCPVPMKLTNGKWQTWLPPKGHSQHETFRHLQREYLSEEYDAQKKRLSAYYETIDNDVFVASYMHNERESDGFRYSVAVWIRNIPTMLPKVEWIFFMKDQSTQHLMARWDDVLKTVPQRMQLDATCFPLRWRIDGYPTKEEFRQMKARPTDVDELK